MDFTYPRRPWMLWVFTLSISAFTMVLLGEPEPSMAAASAPDSSVFCFSKCNTCPMICSPPSPPPPPPPPPPSLLLPPPPPADDSSYLCISKCETCPLICAPPPPSPPSSSPPPTPPAAIYIWTNETRSPPSKSPPPPSKEGERGGLSYPYYYFYTSEATRSSLLPGIIEPFTLLVTFSAFFGLLG